MAQPLFDEHPLQDYFLATGEGTEDMPGGVLEFAADPDVSVPDGYAATLPERVFSFLVRFLQSRPESTFAERFKYDVISSSLLSASISAAPPSATRRAFTPELPGKLDETGQQPESTDEPAVAEGHNSSVLEDFEWPVTLASIAAAALSAEYYFVAIFLFGGATYTRHVSKTKHERADAISLTMSALNELTSAGNVWDSAVSEAISIIETEERSIFYGPTSPQSPSSALRVTLQSSLHTTQTQCDNVRQLLSALTDPSLLSQLSEMYAPSSPLKPSFSILDNPRPVSVPFPPSHRRHISLTTPPSDKRATWNGSYASLALQGSPTAHLMKRKMNRQSDMSVLLGAPKESMSAPASPQVAQPLQGVQEEEDAANSNMDLEEHFGAAALGLHRKRRSAVTEVFGVSPPSYTRANDASSRQAKRSSMYSPTFAAASHLTPVHTTRHPLSLSGLHLALHGALSAKRYACAQLLALRFGEDEDDAYWEDVRSVMALLTSTFEDASARLHEALQHASEKRIQDERPSPERHARSGSSHRPAKSMAEMVSFAPMPSHLSRFAAHVDAISSALHDAREHLEECVAALRGSAADDAPLERPDVQQLPAFQAYDRLRKELGIALRECERGRERLLDIIAPATHGDGEDTPLLGQDNGSDASERAGPSSPAQLQRELPDVEVRLEDVPEHEARDDATVHLLLSASSQHLPPAGVEQVFESDSGGGVLFARERSKLTREERIRLAKAHRESGMLGVAPAEPVSAGGERWGPGGEVVQELKDVIWKVSEKRRRMSERSGVPVEESDAPAEVEEGTEVVLRTERSHTPPGPVAGGPMLLFS
ncbi:hypothetical protein B0H21DRAFT_743784 [Amylocystis lapponica]|nr:hypothetical protein B0H21DRAFT_743784 [Amylocystis lapponica]